MNEISPALLEATAASFEERLVPTLFQIWTGEMLDAAGIAPSHRVLDVACGTGVLARAARSRVGSGGAVTGLDLNPGMLAVARRIAPEIEWHQGDAQSLPFEEGIFDAAICQFGFMFFPDPAAALREMARVVKPGGRIAVAVFDSLARNDGYKRMAGVFGDKVGKELEGAMRLPFALGDKSLLAEAFRMAELGPAACVTEAKTAKFPDCRALVLADVEGWFPLAGIQLDESEIDAVVEAAEAAMTPYTAEDGGVAFPVQAHIFTTTKT